MSTVEIYSNWCYIDRLDGKALEDKERIRLQWPDGTTGIYEIAVKKGSGITADHGHDYEYPISEAFAVVSVHGAQAYVRLVGMMAERV